MLWVPEKVATKVEHLEMRRVDLKADLKGLLSVCTLAAHLVDLKVDWTAEKWGIWKVLLLAVKLAVELEWTWARKLVVLSAEKWE